MEQWKEEVQKKTQNGLLQVTTHHGPKREGSGFLFLPTSVDRIACERVRRFLMPNDPFLPLFSVSSRLEKFDVVVRLFPLPISSLCPAFTLNSPLCDPFYLPPDYHLPSRRFRARQLPRQESRSRLLLLRSFLLLRIRLGRRRRQRQGEEEADEEEEEARQEEDGRVGADGSVRDEVASDRARRGSEHQESDDEERKGVHRSTGQVSVVSDWVSRASCSDRWSARSRELT
jgi:hypothetical protein